ncbi:MAG TPA: hypothetical protein VNO79_09325, partial [Actinomycetota bacterium]|nr:hypothetical protein [Actinomycetota bacterium]
EARSWVGDLELVAGRTMIREFLARAYRYRHDLGDPDALGVALALAAEVDNPALRRRIERVARVLGT